MARTLCMVGKRQITTIIPHSQKTFPSFSRLMKHFVILVIFALATPYSQPSSSIARKNVLGAPGKAWEHQMEHFFSLGSFSGVCLGRE